MPESDMDATSVDPVAPLDRSETWATWFGVLWVSMVAVIDAVFGGKFGLIGLLAVGPFIVAGFAGSRRTALVGLYATVFALILSTPPRAYDQLNHILRVLTLVVSSGVAIWMAHLRTQRSRQLVSARTETRDERRRRVAAETAQRMQAMARALTTAAEPSQVAEAVFSALRDELHVDAATFATTNERGVLTVHARFGYDPGEPDDGVLLAMDPDGAIGDVLRRHVALFAQSVTELRRDWPAMADALGWDRFNALAVVPLVVSDRAVGALVVHWVKPRSASEADKSFLFTIAGAAAQAIERARLTLMEFENLERMQHLHHLSSALAAATTPGDVARAAIASSRRALGAQSAAFRVPVVGERTLLCLASSGHPPLLARGEVPVERTPSGAAFAQSRTVTTTLGAAEFIDDDLSYEVVPRVVSDLDQPVTIIAEPLNGSVGPLGVLVLAFMSRPEPAEVELRFLSTLAGLTAQALERAQLFEQERQALRDAESSRERLSLLSEVTMLLSSSLDPSMVIQRTMTLVVGRLADACMVQVPGENGLQRLDVQVAGNLGEIDPFALIGSDETPFDSDTPAAIAYRTGRAQLAPTSSTHFDVVGRSDATALAIPLLANGEVIGVMTFADGSGRHFEPDDVSLATEVASRTGVALFNATRFQREHVVAEVLQRAVLPDFLPTVEGLSFDAEYRAGAAGTYVGGDWYDVFQLDAEHVMFSVGDVMGKGAPAAALMGQVRSAIRAYAVTEQHPSEILSSLDRLFDSLVEERVVTVVVGVINPTTGSIQLANAGHPPPLIVAADGSTSYCTARSSLLIAAGLGSPPRPALDITLSAGDTLVMYSDGLIERRGELISVGMDRLAQEATAIAKYGWTGQPAAALANALSEDEAADDVVVLSLSYAGVESDGTESSSRGTRRDGMSTLRLEPVVASTPMARHWIKAHLSEVSTEVAGCAALLTSELVTNAVLHAGTPLSVTLHMMYDRIRVDVADGDPTLPGVKDYGPDAATGRGLTLFDTLASEWGVQLVAGGKIVWFELPVVYSVEPDEVSDGNFRFDLTRLVQPELHAPVENAPTTEINLIGIPVDLLQKASEEYEGLFREMRLMKEHAEANGNFASPLPDRLSVLLAEIGNRFAGFGPGMEEVWQGVVDRGESTYDWRLNLPESAVLACEFYDAMLDEADEFGLSSHLLSLPATTTSVAVRRWFLSELIDQLHGQAATSWSDSRFHDEVTERTQGN